MSQGRVFAIGGAGMAAVVLTAAGLTWASQGGGSAEPAGAVFASPAASAVAAAKAPVGECGLVAEGRLRTLPLNAARKTAMVVAVGQQVRAPDVQTARAVDAALAQPEHQVLRVTDALALLAERYDTPATADSLASLRAMTTPGGLTCTYAPDDVKREKRGEDGLTPRAEKVRSSVRDAFGKLRTTGYGPSGRVFDVHVPGAAEKAETPTGVSDEARARGWELAHWLVTRASTHHVSSVTFDGWRWSSAAGAGWKQLPAPVAATPAPVAATPAPVAATPAPSALPPSALLPSAPLDARSVALQYLDRVHIAVATGR